MHSAWLHQNKESECLLFFNGWGMDPEPFRTLPAEGRDVLMLYDYRVLEPVSLENLVGYERLHLLAWSMGVWVAGHLLVDLAKRFVSRIALGGTLRPIDGQRGIPPERYQALVEAFDQQTLDGFHRSMFDDQADCRRFLNHRPKRGIPELAEELESFRAAVDRHGPAEDIYTHTIITSRDRIFSGRNQLRAWGKSKSRVMNWSHFPFYACTDWGDLLPLSEGSPSPR